MNDDDLYEWETEQVFQDNILDREDGWSAEDDAGDWEDEAEYDMY